MKNTSKTNFTGIDSQVSTIIAQMVELTQQQAALCLELVSVLQTNTETPKEIEDNTPKKKAKPANKKQTPKSEKTTKKATTKTATAKKTESKNTPKEKNKNKKSDSKVKKVWESYIDENGHRCGRLVIA